MVETGFRFCDGCGTKLSLTTGLVTEPSARTMSVSSDPVAIPAIPVPRRRRPLLGRLRGRRSERLEVAVVDLGMSDTPRRLQATADVIDRPEPATPATGAISRPTPAQQLRGARAAISGWLQRGSVGTRRTTASQRAPVELGAEAPWRPVAVPSTEDESAGGSQRVAFAIQLGIAFLAGLVLVVVITALASVVSDGSIAVLEMGGLPIFIGGAASVVVFALVRTSAAHHPEPGTTRTTTLASVVGGLVALVVAAGVIYQPAVAKRVQPRIERALGVFGNEDVQAVKGIEQDVRSWNDASKDYQLLLETSLREGVDFDQLRDRAGEAEATLEELVVQMRAHARLAQHAELRDALEDLVSVYDDQLGGLRVVNRGLLLDALDLVRTGDSRFKDAENRAQALFDQRLRPLLKRAGFNADAFGRTLAG